AELPAVQEDRRLEVRPREGEATRSAVRDGRSERRRLRAERGPVEGDHRVPRKPADEDRLQDEAAPPEPPDLLPDDRKPATQGSGDVHRLVPGLSAPARLVR